jgi:uncharacterized protein (TIGR03435 family)
MNRRLFHGLTALLLSIPALSQVTKPPAFLYVDVHPSAPNAEMVGGRFRAGSRFQASGYTMLDLISRAYNLPWERIAGGPSWIGTDRFDLIAAIPPGVPASASPPMMQAVLAERFQLKVHDETRPVPAYALLSGRQPRLKDSTGGESRCQYKRDRSTITLDCTNMPMNQFARELKDYAQEFFDRPLGDKTNLTGRYDFSLTWTQRDQMRVRNAEGELNGITPQTALEKQLGLECVLRPEPMEVLVIDSVNRVPTPNAPGVVEALNNSTYTHFDVAEVRSHKEEAGFKYDDQETQITYLGFILPAFINMAWNTPPQKRQVIGPDWIKTEKFDIIAKPANRTAWENMQLMLRNLITERFHLRMHEEDRPTDVYALTVKRTTKLKDAAPNRRSECHIAYGDANLTMTCQNTTMRQLQDRARDQAWGTLDRPVLDQTGLRGAYDFSITWVPGPWNRQQPAAPAEGMASAPTGEISFFEAMEKQLGLKLTKQKLPYPALVVDSVERPKDQ